jgi:cytochrome c oxidase subunit 2
MKKFILLFLPFLLLGCSQMSPEEAASVSDDINEVAEEVTVDIPDNGSTVKEFDITAKNWNFMPGTLTVNKGDTVKLNITSIDVEHGFMLLAFGVSEGLRPGETTEIEFVADKVGTFSFYCSVFCGSGHRDMTGELIVQ